LASSVVLFLGCAIVTIGAQAAGPAAGYRIDPVYMAAIEQYAKAAADGSRSWRF
jgi:hypothetical protein